MRLLTRSFAIIVALGSMFAAPATAQERVDLGATAYVDYFYNLSSPDEEEEGFNGFTYRRLFLTADFLLNDAFTSRVRLEANAGTTQGTGPVPFVKDLWLRWTSRGGHRVTGGVQPPPAFEVTESVWGYRSLEKTVMDLFGVVDSRDFGLRVDGPLTPGGGLRYAAMLANNNGVRPETDKHKRAYAQLEARPAEHLVFTAGADYASYDEGSVGRDNAIRFSALGGYVADAFTVGVEAFHARTQYASDVDLATQGVSVFGRATVSPGWEVVARVDRGRFESPFGSDDYQTFAVAGVSYAPTAGVRLIPNVYFAHEDGDDESFVSARMTLELNF